jgi:Ca2+-binding EF-hand superfamily protein
MAGASEAELREVRWDSSEDYTFYIQAFKLFDADGDGVITIDERKTLISKVGGDMDEVEAKALIHHVDTEQRIRLHIYILTNNPG